MGRGVIPRRVDVAVVGGGLAGVSAAYFLSRARLRTLLLEARTLASGATGRGTGLITTGLGEPYVRSIARYGRRRAREAWRFTRENHRLVRRLVRSLGLSCGYSESGGQRAFLDAREEEAWRESLPLLRGDGFRARRDRGVLPGAFRGALWMESDGLINPAAFVRGLAGAARENGALIMEHTRVERLRVFPGEVGVRTSGGEVRCARVVAAPSVGLGRIVPRLRGTVVPRRSVVAEVWAPGVPAPGICCSGDFYWRPAGRDRLLVGGPSGPRLGSFIRKAFPGARRTGRGWSGTVDWGADGFPTVGPVPGSPRLLACAGFCGTGFGYATAAASLCADIAAGRSNRIPAWMEAARWRRRA